MHKSCKRRQLEYKSDKPIKYKEITLKKIQNNTKQKMPINSKENRMPTSLTIKIRIWKKKNRRMDN